MFHTRFDEIEILYLRKVHTRSFRGCVVSDFGARIPLRTKNSFGEFESLGTSVLLLIELAERKWIFFPLQTGEP